MRICDAFGEGGFFYIPGSDTCLETGGHVRAEMHYVDGDPDVLLSDGTPEQSNANFNNWTSRARGNVHFDAKTNSGIGLIQTYIELEFTIGPDDYAEDYSDTETELTYAFVKISNDHGIFTAGRQDSFFDFYSSDDFGTRIDIDDNTTEQTLFAYTFERPEAASAARSRSRIRNRPDGVSTAPTTMKGRSCRTSSATSSVEQEWGSAQIMGVARHIHDKTTLPAWISGDGNGDQDGWLGGRRRRQPEPAAPRVSTFSTQVGYADGALAYITTDPGGIGDFAGPDGDDTNQAWMGRAGFLCRSPTR